MEDVSYKSEMTASLGRSSRRSRRFMVTEALQDVSVHYQVLEQELGVGLYGTVRKCKHRETGEWCAVKSIKKNKVNELETLKREIKILQEVSHPNIIKLLDVYEDDRYLHLVTELCTGGELFDRIIEKFESDEGHFSEMHAASLVRDILDAIRYCHDVKGIVHRDLKPENFLFLNEDEDSPIKIIDFGLSRHDDADGVMKTRVGTPYYVAPEVLRQKYTNSCDVWSIGVITYILLCGYPPFAGDDDIEVFESVQAGEFDFPEEEWDEISETAKDFICHLLQLEPEDRPSAKDAMKHPWFEEQLGQDKLLPKTSQRNISSHSKRMANFSKYLSLKKLKHQALGLLADDLAEVEIEPLEQAFQQIAGENQSNFITLDELDLALEEESFSEKIREELMRVRESLETSKQKRINWKDFLVATIDKQSATNEKNIKKIFKRLGKGEGKHLQLDDLTRIFGDEAVAQEMMRNLDSDGDGLLDYDDFRLTLQRILNEDYTTFMEDDDVDDDDEFHDG